LKTGTCYSSRKGNSLRFSAFRLRMEQTASVKKP